MATEKNAATPDPTVEALEKLSVLTADVATTQKELGVVVEGKATREELTEVTDKLVSQETHSADIAEIHKRQDEAEAARKAPNITVEDKGIYQNMGQFMADVMLAATPGQLRPERLIKYTAGHANEGDDSQGGHLVPAEFIPELFTKPYSEASILAKCRQFPVRGNRVGIPTAAETSRQTGSRWGGITAYWLEEMGGKSPTKPTFEKIEMSLHKLALFGFASDELLEDSFITFESYLSQAFASEAQWMLEDAVINGTGAGMPRGILLPGCLVTVPLHASQAPVRTTVITENLVEMIARMWAPSWPNAVWLIEQSLLPQLLTLSLAVGAGGSIVSQFPIYAPPGVGTSNLYGSILGRPVIPCEHCAALGAVGDIILADFSQYGFISKTGRFETSIHLLFDYDEKAFRFVVRIDGQPMWRVPMTPASGGATLSPFVTLGI